jgi:ATP-dependent DNA helicase RecQ
MIEHAINPLLQNPSSMLLFVAPAGSGKTSLIIDLYQKKRFSKIIFLSPLRAISNELAMRMKGIPDTFLLESFKDIAHAQSMILNNQNYFLVSTPELMGESFFNALESSLEGSGERPLIVLDEFHLFLYWGKTFRPHLLDRLISLYEISIPILALTATMDNERLTSWRTSIKKYREDVYYLNGGNHQLHNFPIHCYFYSGLFKKTFHHIFLIRLFKLRDEEMVIYFCRYKKEVEEWLEICQEMGVSALGCVGGETQKFLTRLEVKRPRCIFTTSALSHGVNLPNVRGVFISYKIGNLDFWTQIIARGGRRGESFIVHSFDRFHKTLLNQVSDTFRLIWFNLLARVELFFSFWISS